MLPSWCTETVTVTRASAATTGRRTEREWAHATTHAVAGCSVQPGGTSTGVGTVDAVSVADATLVAPVGADLAEGDRVTATSGTYVVDGIPYAWTSSTGRVSHVQARLRKWAG